MRLRVLVCGGRAFRDSAVVHLVLDGIHKETPIGCLIEGGASGVDIFANHWAADNGIACATFKACWNKYGKQAGPIRNGWMLEHGRPDLVVAFPGGRGTANMIERARSAGVNVREIAP